jgi:ligand-binding sensor domain-containing protein
VNHFAGGRFTSISKRDGFRTTRSARSTGRRRRAWIGTAAGDVNRWQNGRVEAWTTANGLSNDQVTSLADDGAGGVWIGTRKGLGRWSAGKLTILTTPKV